MLEKIGLWTWPLFFIWYKRVECVELSLCATHAPCGATLPLSLLKITPPFRPYCIQKTYPCLTTMATLPASWTERHLCVPPVGRTFCDEEGRTLHLHGTLRDNFGDKRHTASNVFALVSIIGAQSSRYSDWLQAGRPRGRSSSPDGENIFSSPLRPDRVWRPPSLLSEVKKLWIYTSTPPYAFTHRDNFTL
jgi:hypothetical protein